MHGISIGNTDKVVVIIFKGTNDFLILIVSSIIIKNHLTPILAQEIITVLEIQFHSQQLHLYNINTNDMAKICYFKIWNFVKYVSIVITIIIFTACPGKEEIESEGYVIVTNASNEVIFVTVDTFLKTNLTAKDTSWIIAQTNSVKLLPSKSEKIKVSYMNIPIHFLIQNEKLFNDFYNGNIVTGDLLNDHYVYTPEDMKASSQLNIMYTGVREGNGNIPYNSDYRH